MTNSATINIKERQFQDGVPEDTEMITQGTVCTDESGDPVISFREGSAHEFFGGEEGDFTKITLKGKAVIMDKKGMQLVFEEGIPYAAFYSTPFGSMRVSVYPRLVQFQTDDSGGTIRLHYILSIAGAQTVNSMSISYDIPGEPPKSDHERRKNT